MTGLVTRAVRRIAGRWRGTVGRRPRVFVGVSGGVDSSVAAAILKRRGYEVIGVFIRTWQPDWVACTWRAERRDAMRACAHLDIPFVELDLEDEYRKGVADFMIAEYRAGRTPNPDVMCNREVKFGGFLDWALAHGADAVATGHYARSEGGNLLRGVDPSKDQSYFLWTLSGGQLAHVLFPVGGMRKAEVRALARTYGIPVAGKKDSQGICFIGEVDMKEFLGHYVTQRRGDVMDESGEVVGFHQGALLYTLGERHGFSITRKGTHDRPLYVVAKDIERNTLTVSERPAPVDPEPKRRITGCVWRTEPVSGRTYVANVRYHGEPKACLVGRDARDAAAGSATLSFDDQNVLVAPGQSVVLYDGDTCIGGGIVA